MKQGKDKQTLSITIDLVLFAFGVVSSILWASHFSVNTIGVVVFPLLFLRIFIHNLIFREDEERKLREWLDEIIK